VPPAELNIDTIELGKQAEIPVKQARVKVFGIGDQAAIDSLAGKLWLIENAEHTIDLMYYIFKSDLVGNAVLGALCDAVQRGVDVRIMVDSVGSISLNRAAIRALMSCGEQAGFIRTVDGQVTTRKARVQGLVFNALSKLGSSPNRRSHDKLLIVDGNFPAKAGVMTGGRNISLSYYGLREDGSPEPDTYRDMEVFLRTAVDSAPGDETVGNMSEIYYSLLFLFPHNLKLDTISNDRARSIYARYRAQAQESLAAIKTLPAISASLVDMPSSMNDEFVDARVLLAHEFGNLTDKNVISNPVANQNQNPNSIMYVLNEIEKEMPAVGSASFVSPYLFVARYRDGNKELILDEAEELLALLRENPNSSVEIITNSVLTSDNFSAQSIIDMNTAPRLLLSPELQDAWLAAKETDGAIAELVESEAWQQQINNPQIRIYQTGRLDAAGLGHGDVNYGKLHAKFVVIDQMSFVGTTNFDYRSRLFNNEMGFFMDSPQLADVLNEEIEALRQMSYLWGTPEWLEMRRAVIEKGGMKGQSTRRQRTIYKTLRATGAKWLF
jgi:phosphatidylserine/phosphatidylglycerophosphate/cardiolipin synthase-like enzyme